MKNYAPIVLFVYNRPWHTEQTVKALLKNELADASDLIIYSDAPKRESAAQNVEQVRRYIKSITGFKSVTIIEREKNLGLADNIIDGVTSVVNEFGSVIVLEDDIVTSPYFLRFMNEALKFYERKEKVWHINGYLFPIDSKDLNDTFFTMGMFCWGWGTWERAWKHYRRDPEKLPSRFSRSMIREFNYENSNDFFGQVLANKSGKLRTWAIFWYATIYLNQGLCLCSKYSLATNIGHDGSGMHCDKNSFFEVSLRGNSSFHFATQIQESADARKLLIFFYRSLQPSILARIKRKLLEIGARCLKNVVF